MVLVNRDRRGRTASGKFAHRPIVQLQPEDYPPDSNFWKGRAQGSVDRLINLVGTTAARKWQAKELTDTDTWLAIAEKAEKKIREIKEQPCHTQS